MLICPIFWTSTEPVLKSEILIQMSFHAGILETEMPSRAKLELFHKCEEIVLAPLKEASHTGVHLKDPFGQSQWVFPRLCLYICDQTEGSRITCTFDTNKSNYPCSCCFCPKESLSNVARTFSYRDEKRMVAIFEEMRQSSVQDQKQLSKEQSIYPVRVSTTSVRRALIVQREFSFLGTEGICSIFPVVSVVVDCDFDTVKFLSTLIDVFLL